MVVGPGPRLRRDDDVCVAFSGGLLELGPLNREVTGVVVRLGDRVIRITPPALTSYRGGDDRWQIRAQTLRYRVDLDGRGVPEGPHALPVPLPRAAQHRQRLRILGGSLRCTVREWGPGHLRWHLRARRARNR